LSMNNLKYMIFNYSNVTDEMIGVSLETNRDTLRHSVSGIDKVILKYDPSKGTPSVFWNTTQIHDFSEENLNNLLNQQ